MNERGAQIRSAWVCCLMLVVVIVRGIRSNLGSNSQSGRSNGSAGTTGLINGSMPDSSRFATEDRNDLHLFDALRAPARRLGRTENSTSSPAKMA
jgi:hypothetical protein